jgi:hypothetical protein
LVKLFVGSGTEASSFSIDNTYINSTYDNYLVFVNAAPSEHNRTARIRFNTSNSANTNSYYYYETEVHSSSTHAYNHSGTDGILLAYQGIGHSSGGGTGGTYTSNFYLMNVNSTTTSTYVHGATSIVDTSDNSQSSTFRGGFILGQRALVTNGFTLYFSSGNITVNSIAVYGIAK